MRDWQGVYGVTSTIAEELGPVFRHKYETGSLKLALLQSFLRELSDPRAIENALFPVLALMTPEEITETYFQVCSPLHSYDFPRVVEAMLQLITIQRRLLYCSSFGKV